MWLKTPEEWFGREARNVANILHAEGKLKVDSHHDVMRRLFDEAIRMSGGYNAQDAANSIWAVATMGVDDPRIVNGLAKACVNHVRDFNEQDAANSLWAIATLGVADPHVISSLSDACVDKVRNFNPQETSNALWSAAVLNIKDKVITNYYHEFSHCSCL
jgi:hypothetical protein